MRGSRPVGRRAVDHPYPCRWPTINPSAPPLQLSLNPTRAKPPSPPLSKKKRSHRVSQHPPAARLRRGHTRGSGRTAPRAPHPASGAWGPVPGTGDRGTSSPRGMGWDREVQDIGKGGPLQPLPSLTGAENGGPPPSCWIAGLKKCWIVGKASDAGGE